MRYAPFLNENGVIGFVAPSFGATTRPYAERFDNALKIFESMGYRAKIGPNCRVSQGIGISNTPQNCAKELMESYMDRESDVLVSVGGGELMCEVVPYLDFNKLANSNPKWYIGYSDNTNFTFLLTTLADTASIYGYCAGTYGMNEWDESVKDNFAALTGKKMSFSGYEKWEKTPIDPQEFPLASYNLTEERIIRRFPDKDVSFSGRLVGGCVDCLVNLCGTEFDKVKEFALKYKDDGIIWFLECCDLNLFSMRRAMWNLKNAGWFKYVKGFVFGRPRYDNGEAYMGLDQYNAITDILGDLNVPIIMDIDIGHLPPTMPVICGSMATVTVKDNDYTIEMRLE